MNITLINAGVQDKEEKKDMIHHSTSTQGDITSISFGCNSILLLFLVYFLFKTRFHKTIILLLAPKLTFDFENLTPPEFLHTSTWQPNIHMCDINNVLQCQFYQESCSMIHTIAI